LLHTHGCGGPAASKRSDVVDYYARVTTSDCPLIFIDIRHWVAPDARLRLPRLTITHRGKRCPVMPHYTIFTYPHVRMLGDCDTTWRRRSHGLGKRPFPYPLARFAVSNSRLSDRNDD